MKKTGIKLHDRHAKAFQVENWNDPKYIDDPDSKPKIFRNPPKRYEQHFLAKMDKRSVAYQVLHESFSEIVQDRGGVESLSHIQLALIEKFCFLEFMLHKKELEMAESNNKGMRDKNFGSYCQWLNCLIGLSKSVGLERRAKTVASLETYIKQKKKHKN